jgi:hypothetical protein
MIGIFWLLILSGVILMGLNTVFIVIASTIPEYIPPAASLIIFIALAAISLIFVLTGFNLHIILPFIL